MIRRGGDSATQGQWRLARRGERGEACASPPPMVRPGSSLQTFHTSAFATARAISGTPVAQLHTATGPVTPPTSPESAIDEGKPCSTVGAIGPTTTRTPQQLREPLLMAGLRIEEFNPSSDFVYTRENAQHIPAIDTNARYAPPVGWSRLGLRTAPIPGAENWVEAWHVAYHAAKNCRQVIVQTVREGFRIEDGSGVGSRSGPGVKDPRPSVHHVYTGVPPVRGPRHISGVYCSPDVEYTQRRVQTRSSAIGDGLMIECRVRPGSYQKFQAIETDNPIGGSRPICKHTLLSRTDELTGRQVILTAVSACGASACGAVVLVAGVVMDPKDVKPCALLFKQEQQARRLVDSSSDLTVSYTKTTNGKTSGSGIKTSSSVTKANLTSRALSHHLRKVS